jgi:hypothetical protein
VFNIGLFEMAPRIEGALIVVLDGITRPDDWQPVGLRPPGCQTKWLRHFGEDQSGAGIIRFSHPR